VSHKGIQGMRAAGDDVFGVVSGLTDSQWHAASAASGWSVKDVVIHLGSLLELLQGAVAGGDIPPLGIEELNDQVVGERRDWTPSQTMQFLREQLDSALDTFSGLQDEPVASTLVPMLDLGSYPLHSIAEMFTFDMTTHLHFDILAPRGPIALVHPPLDEIRLGPSVEWLLGGIPQMQPDLANTLDAPIGLRLTGPGGRHVLLSPSSDRVNVTGGADTAARAAATVTSTTEAFLAWSTRRLPWSGTVRIDGDEHIAARFLDALNLI
jgi:uncharacterized protein (TIGR03083 family)